MFTAYIAINNTRDLILMVNDFKLMMPKCSPVRYTIPALEQPVPENKKTRRKAFKGGSGVEPAKYPPKVKSENALTTLEC